MKKDNSLKNGMYKEKPMGWKQKLTMVIAVTIVLCICLFVFYPVFHKQEPAVSESNIHKIMDIPEYTDKPYVEINDNQPFFSDKDLTKEAFEEYSELDDLGRCGPAYANLCSELMPKEERESTWEVEPSGWHIDKYNGLVEGGNLYNRCHLIAFSLAGENANEKNLITGTRYMNAEGMLPFEQQVQGYVKDTGNHVLYRVTPVFKGDNLVADGVEMEAFSVEDSGKGVCFHIFAYNVQPGVIIDYKTGDNKPDPDYVKPEEEENPENRDVALEDVTFIININKKKFHDPSCNSVVDIKEKNKVYSTKSREELIEEGYKPCSICNP